MAIGALNVGVPKQITATANVLNRPGALLGIVISSFSASPTITIYDSATTTTTAKVVDTITVNGSTPDWFAIPIALTSGCYIVISGTLSITAVVSG